MLVRSNASAREPCPGAGAGAGVLDGAGGADAGQLRADDERDAVAAAPARAVAAGLPRPGAGAPGRHGPRVPGRSAWLGLRGRGMCESIQCRRPRLRCGVLRSRWREAQRVAARARWTSAAAAWRRCTWAGRRAARRGSTAARPASSASCWPAMRCARSGGRALRRWRRWH